jgi:hypothetical protein
VGYETSAWIAAGAGYGEDYRPPQGATVWYVLAPVGSTSDKPAYERASVVTPGNEAWLRNPLHPSLSRSVAVASTGDESEPVRQHIHEVSGRRLPLVVHDVREGRHGAVTLLVRSREERDALEVLLVDGSPLLLTMCNSKMWMPLMMAVGQATWTRVTPHIPAGTYLGQRLQGPVWQLVLDYVEVRDDLIGVIDRIKDPVWLDVRDNLIPPIGVGSGVPGAFYTWGDVNTQFKNWLDLAIGKKKV